MSHINQDFFDFLKDLSNNNNREWFKENKKRYELSIKIPFEYFIQDLINRIHEIDERITITPKEAIFRIYKDVRFIKDKRPYKEQVSAIISQGGRKDFTTPGTYIEIHQDNWKIYGGAYFLEKDQLQRLREHITSNLDEFESLMNAKEFKKWFGSIQGEANKRIPKEFKEVFEKQPLIANKQFYYFARLEPKKLLAKNVMETIMKIYKASLPMNEFLEDGMK
jgi:uncharacterized protein (TIGR02453 family)